MKVFAREVAAERSREAVMADALQTMTIPLGRHNYKLETQTDSSLVYARTYRPWWAWAATILLFPIGLLAYFALAERAYITVTFEEADGITTMRVSGEGTSKVRDAFDGMSL